MAKVVNLGFIGKLGKFVFYSMNGNNYAKLLPSKKKKKPKTPKQIAHRLVFSKINQFARFIYRGVLKPYTFPRPKSSNFAIFNRMMSINGLILSTDEWNPANLKIFEGPLENLGISSALITGDTVKVSFNTEYGKEDDVAIAVVYDDKTGLVYYAVGTRSAGSLDVLLSKMASKNADTLHAYLVFSRLPEDYVINYPVLPRYGSQGLVSTTAYKKVG